MIVSFDFDGCLSRSDIQKICKMHIESGDDVRITTSRWERPNMGNNNDLLKVANELGISRIVFTAHQPKYEFLHDVDLHYDDNDRELTKLGNRGLLV